ncbi:MAG TPA: hypothetical protein VFZ18_06540, partial [Longimicrobiaceae bacterium]
GHPERLAYRCRRFDPVAAGALSFEPIAGDRFPAFGLGVEAGRTGGGAPVVYNAANEVAVAAFLNDRIGFPEIAGAIADALDAWGGGGIGSVDDVLETDRWARGAAQTFIDRHAHC